MSRLRQHASNAERQRAYRARLAARSSQPYKKPPPPSPRPARLDAVIGAVDTLRDEYQVWLDALPANQEDSSLAERLQATIEQLESATDELRGIVPPKGFGRD